MDKLVARSTLSQGLVDKNAFPVIFDRLKIFEMPLEGLVRVQGVSSDPSFGAAIEKALGVVLPAAERISLDAAIALAWVNPNEYLCFCSLGEEARYVSSLEEGLVGKQANVTLVSDSRIGLLISGEDAAAFLAKGCSIDLHPSSFGAGCAVTTRFAGLPAMLVCRRPGVFALYVDVGYIQYVLRWVIDAADEFSGNEASSRYS